MKPKVLVVEDDRAVLAITSQLLKRLECDVLTAENVPSALAVIEDHKIDLLLTDYALGDQTGEVVIRELRRKAPSVPVIMMTGNVPALPNWLQEAGVLEELFEKPYAAPRLMAAVQEALGHAQRSPTGSQQPALAGAEAGVPKGIEEMVHRVVDQESIVAITDKKGVIVYANDRFCEISGYNRTELIGCNHRLLKSGQHPPVFYKNLWATILSGRAWRGEICNRAKDGHLYYVDTVISPLRTEGLITHFLALRTDITAKKEMETELFRQHKREEEERRMAALGRMANGFLHDLNNVLTGIMGITTEASSVSRDAMLHEAINRLAQLARTLRDYSTGRPSAPEPFRLNPLLACASSLVRHRKGVPRSLVISEQTAGTRTVEVVGNEAQIFEIVLNLVLNAVEAASMKPEPRVVVTARVEGHDVLITVEDNGNGVPAAMKESIFEPYNSTKGAGRGIGLSVSRNIALAHHGDLRLSRAGGGGVGACFTLSLPARKIEPIAPKIQVVKEGQKNVVLVAEDEADVRRVISRSANELGLTVMNAGDTAGLVALASQMKEVLAAAIIDHCEVESDQGAVACLRRISPDLPIILISARLTVRGHSATPWGTVESLPKPFEPELLVNTLHKAIAGSPVAGGN